LGADEFAGSVPELSGDVIRDLSSEDVLSITGVSLAGEQISLATTSTSSTLSFDTDSDGTPESVLTLEGDYTGESFEVSSVGGGYNDQTCRCR